MFVTCKKNAASATHQNMTTHVDPNNFLPFNSNGLKRGDLIDITSEMPMPTSVYVDLPQLCGIGAITVINNLTHVPQKMIRPRTLALRMVLSGSADVLINGKVIHTAADDMVILRPKDDISFYPDPTSVPRGTFFWCCLDIKEDKNGKWHWPKWAPLDPLMLRDLERAICDTPKIIKASNELRLIANHVIMLHHTQRQYPFFAFRVRHAIVGLLVALYDALLLNKVSRGNEQAEKAIESVRRFMELLETRFAEPMKYETMAHDCNLSTTAFLQTFKKVCGVPPRQYITQLRMQAAKKILLTTEMTNKQIAQEVGFAGESQFYKCYMTFFGETPQYTRQLFRAQLEPWRCPVIAAVSYKKKPV